jgi:hypothetical protein
MWFYIAAIILVVLFVVWFRHTNAYRNRRRQHDPVPGQHGASSTSNWEGPAGDPGGGGYPGPGG